MDADPVVRIKPPLDLLNAPGMSTAISELIKDRFGTYKMNYDAKPILAIVLENASDPADNGPFMPFEELDTVRFRWRGSVSRSRTRLRLSTA